MPVAEILSRSMSSSIWSVLDWLDGAPHGPVMTADGEAATGLLRFGRPDETDLRFGAAADPGDPVEHLDHPALAAPTRPTTIASSFEEQLVPAVGRR